MMWCSLQTWLKPLISDVPAEHQSHHDQTVLHGLANTAASQPPAVSVWAGRDRSGEWSTHRNMTTTCGVSVGQDTSGEW